MVISRHIRNVVSYNRLKVLLYCKSLFYWKMSKFEFIYGIFFSYIFWNRVIKCNNVIFWEDFKETGYVILKYVQLFLVTMVVFKKLFILFEK